MVMPQSSQVSSNIVYNSYAGVDLVAVMLLPNAAPVVISELQTISYSIHRENVPVRAIGHVAPLGFVKGARTVAGSLIFTNFNEYFFYQLQSFQDAIGTGLYPVADMLPPFDVVISAANEYGSMSKMRISGITIVDEGGVMSIDDIISESTFSFMARGIVPMISATTDATRFPNASIAQLNRPRSA